MAATSAVCLVATASGDAHGLWQRLGLTVADAWIVVTASYLVARAHGRTCRAARVTESG